jgi:TolB-like protein
LVLLLLGASFYWLSSRDRAIDSLAVLPFVNASADPNMDYLSDGITEEMINNLSQLSNLRVVPSSSVFRYVKPNSIAQVYLALGDKDQAIAWLQKAEEEHNDYLTLLKVHPGFDHLRTDPRFLEGV